MDRISKPDRCALHGPLSRSPRSFGKWLRATALAGSARVARQACLAAMLALLVACDSTTPVQHLDEAQALIDGGELNAAIIELKNALKKDPAFTPGRLVIGNVYLTLGDYPSALKELQRALDLGSNDPTLSLGLARAKLGLGRVQEVIGELSERDDRSIDEGILLAEAYLSVGKTEEAQPLFAAGREKAEGLAGLAAIAWNDGDLDSAAEYFASATEKAPENPRIWLRRAELALSRGRFEPAKAAFAQAARLPAGTVLGQIGEVRTALAQRDLEVAKVGIDKVLEIAPDYPLARYLEGLIRYQDEDLERAELALREVQRAYPDHGPSLYLMGLIKYQQRQLAQAQDHLDRFLSQNQSSESARKLLATVQYERGEPAAAIETLKPLEGATQDPQVLAMLGTALMQLGEIAEATGYLEQAVELAPDGAAFRNQLALNLLSAGKDERARAELDTAILTDGQQFQSDYLMAMMQLRQGNLEDAKTSVAQIEKKSPDSPVGANLKGAIAISENRLDDAAAAFRRALTIDASFSPARNNLTRLLERQGDLAGAEAVFREQIENNSDDDTSLLGLADLLARNGRKKEAVEFAERASLVNAGSARARLALGRLYVLVGEEEKALETVNDGLRRSAENVDLKLLRSELNVRLGNRDEAQRDLNGLQADLVKRPDNAKLAFVLGRLQVQLGNASMARSNFERAIKMSDGKNAQALLALGRVNLGSADYQAVRKQIAALQALKQPEIEGAAKLLQADLAMANGDAATGQKLYQQLHEAGQREGTLRLAGIALRGDDADGGIKLLQEWLRSNPTDQDARILLSGALLADDKGLQAIDEYEKLVATDNPVVLNNLAWLYMEKGDPRAAATAERAYAGAPNNADVADTYGWILVQNGQLEEAITVLKRSVELKSDNPTTLYHLAIARYQFGQLGQARRVLERALKFEAFAEREEAQTLLKEIGG